MKTLNTFIFFLIAISCLSCKKSQTFLSIGIDMVVLNHQGQNLLANPAVYKKEDIDIFYVNNGQVQLYNKPNLSGDKGFLLLSSNNINVIRIDLNHDRNEQFPLTLVKFGNSKIDTIKAKFHYGDNSTEVEAVWFNGVQKDLKNFTIIK